MMTLHLVRQGGEKEVTAAHNVNEVHRQSRGSRGRQAIERSGRAAVCRPYTEAERQVDRRRGRDAGVGTS